MTSYRTAWMLAGLLFALLPLVPAAQGQDPFILPPTSSPSAIQPLTIAQAAPPQPYLPVDPQAAPYAAPPATGDPFIGPAQPAWPNPMFDPTLNCQTCGDHSCSGLVASLLGVAEPVYLPNYYDPFDSQQFAYGAMGNTPYRLSWYSQRSLAYIPSSPTNGVSGDFQATEFNSSLRYATILNREMLFALTGEWNRNYWSGPTGVALPPRADQFRADFEWASIDPGPWNWQIGITPQINSDFERQLTSHAYMIDARLVFLNKMSPELTLALGVTYWNRVNDYILPYGGLIWAPDDRWEIRAMFPKSRISYYIGNGIETDFWLYGSAEWNVDAYQVDLEDSNRTKDRIEFRDIRFLLGVNAQRRKLSAFFEGGYITDRQVTFAGKTPDFSIGDNWMLRAGFAY